MSSERMNVQRKRMAGGYRFRRFEGRPEPVLEQMPVPPRVFIPLEDPRGAALAPLVKSGEKVRAGQIIAAGEQDEARPALATVNGVVEDLREIARAGRKVRTAVIVSDGTATWTPMSGHGPGWERLSAEQLDGLIYSSGVPRLCRSGFPTRLGGAAIEPGRVEHVIVQETQSEVYPVSLQVLLDGEGASRLADGLRILGKALPGAALHLALSLDQKDLAERLAGRLDGGGGIRGWVVEPKYPLHREEVLVPTLLGRRVPPGISALDLGILVLDVQAVIQLAEAVVDGKPALERIVTLSGPGFTRNPHVRVRIGTPIGEVIGEALRTGRKVRVVLNSAMDGETVTDLSLPIEAQHTHLIALPEDEAGQPFFFARPGFRKDSYSRSFLSSLLPLARSVETNLHGDPRPCINCSYCENVCPAQLLPHLLHRYVQHNLIEETLVHYRIFRCLDCNLCTYVCPSKIPVARLIREGKERLVAEGLGPAQPAAAGGNGEESPKVNA